MTAQLRPIANWSEAPSASSLGLSDCWCVQYSESFYHVFCLIPCEARSRQCAVAGHEWTVKYQIANASQTTIQTDL